MDCGRQGAERQQEAYEESQIERSFHVRRHLRSKSSQVLGSLPSLTTLVCS
jgi:hypothetical protein